MNTLQTQNNICEAIDIIVQQAINNAGFDRTIQATVINCTDESVGQYKVRYQDSTFYAYAQNAEDKYSAGAGVYILIQNNDMARDKFIIGTVDKLGKDYISITDESDRYEKIGTSCITLSNDIQLCSYKKNDIEVITEKETVDNEALLTYSQEAEFLAIKMNIQTALDRVQRRLGNYGLKFELLFKDAVNENAELITKTYVINIDSMVGNPYLYIDKTAQFFTIAIDPDTFVGIKSITAFCEKFPNEKEDMPDDIFFSDLEIYAAMRLDEIEINASRITFLSPQGLIFSSTVSTLNVQAVVRVSNEVKNTGVDYYWFIEDPTVTTDSIFYSVYGGQGWKCLNFYDIIELEDGSTISEWKPDINTKSFKIENNQAKEVQYKCIAKTNEEILSKEFTLYNSLAKYEIFVTSDSGTTFYNGLGNPVLSCIVKEDGTVASANFKYAWTKIDNNNLSVILNEQSNTCQISISSIDEFATYKCAVYDEEGVFIGANEITILNKKGTEGTYNLVINNGTQTFIYNEDGVSPTSSSLENPMIILPLSFTLFDNVGQKIEDSVLEKLDFVWKVPAENTLLKVEGGELIDGYYHLSNDNFQLNYDISSSYSVTKNNNQIELNLTYKDLKLKAFTNFFFTKEGEIGTNGTGVVAYITAKGCTENEEAMWYKDVSNNIYSNYSHLYFTLQSSTEVLVEGADNSSSNINWKVLRNTEKVGNQIITDGTHFQYTAGTGINYIDINENDGSPAADIVQAQASANNLKYFSAYPLITANIIEGNVIPFVYKGTGCRSVKYTADGTNPKYNNSIPFKIGLKNSNNEILDIVNYDFVWSTESTELNLIVEDLEKNECLIRPVETYDGRAVNVSLDCFISAEGIDIEVHIPIYFYLDTYGYSALNDWDGNSLDINNDGGYILTPQVGAGIKNADNTFTGLLMGKVKLNIDSSEKIGLVGLYNGIQTIFLDSQTGGAYFGQVGDGQIKIIPGQEPVIEGGGYDQDNTKGLQINLSANNPGIKFGNGNFSVNSNGILTANDVDLTGKITATSGYIGTKESGFLINSNYISKGNITNVTQTTTAGIYIGVNGINISGGTAATTSYITPGDVNIGGKLTWKNNVLTVEGNITTTQLTATGGTIGCWKLNSNRMYDDSNNTGYTGVNKYGQGQAFWAGGTDLSGNNAPFRVNHSGYLVANSAKLTGEITATTITAKNEYKIYVQEGTNFPVIWAIEPTQWNSDYATIAFGVAPTDPTMQIVPALTFNMFNVSAGANSYCSADLFGGDQLSLSAGYNGYNHLYISDDNVEIYSGGNKINFQLQAQFDYEAEDVFIISQDSNGIFLRSIYTYDRTYSGAANMRVTDQGTFGRHSSSSVRYKNIIKKISAQDIKMLYDIPTYWFKYKENYLNKKDERYQQTIPGFIVEDWDEIFPIAIDHNQDGTPEMWNNEIITPLMFEMIKYNNQEINELKQQVKQLQAKLDNI